MAMTTKYSLRSSKKGIKARETAGLTGLRNIGNSCYMNAVIQCLSNTKPLIEFLLEEFYVSKINPMSTMKGAIITELARAIQFMWQRNKSVDLSELKMVISRFARQFKGNKQQDPQEFLRYLLDGVNKDIRRITSNPKPGNMTTEEETNSGPATVKAFRAWYRYLNLQGSEIADMFVGQMRSSLKCTYCGNITVLNEQFWDISLPIPPGRSGIKLMQCFDLYTKEEVLDGVYCSRCSRGRTCTKRYQLEIFPTILVLHINRISLMGRRPRKLNTLVDYPINGLDLSRFAPRGALAKSYNLYGVAHHWGTVNRGHYVADCRHPYTGDWHRYNDSVVTSINPKDAVSRDGYILFYKADRLV